MNSIPDDTVPEDVRFVTQFCTQPSELMQLHQKGCILWVVNIILIYLHINPIATYGSPQTCAICLGGFEEGERRDKIQQVPSLLDPFHPTSFPFCIHKCPTPAPTPLTVSGVFTVDKCTQQPPTILSASVCCLTVFVFKRF